MGQTLTHTSFQREEPVIHGCRSLLVKLCCVGGLCPPRIILRPGSNIDERATSCDERAEFRAKAEIPELSLIRP
jgi:hypothetical protein